GEMTTRDLRVGDDHSIALAADFDRAGDHHAHCGLAGLADLDDGIAHGALPCESCSGSSPASLVIHCSCAGSVAAAAAASGETYYRGSMTGSAPRKHEPADARAVRNHDDGRPSG